MEYHENKLLKKKAKFGLDENYEALAETCLQLGELYKDREEPLRALNEYKIAARAYDKLNKPMDRGVAYRMVGEMHSMLGQYKEALQNVQAYMRAAKKHCEIKALQEAHTTLGRVYLHRAESLLRQAKKADADSDLANAVKEFQTALTICDDLPATVKRFQRIDMQARAHLNLGITYDYQEKAELANDSIERALNLARSAELFDLQYTCYNALALCYSRWESKDTGATKQTGQTLRLLNQALEVASRLPHRATKMCQTLMLMATFFLKMDDFQSARQTLKRAYRLQTPVADDAKRIERKLKVLVAMCRIEDELITTGEMDLPRRKVLYERMGDGACKLRNFEKAIGYYQRMLQCAEELGETDRELLPCYVSLYQTYIDNQQYEEALKYLQKEHDIIANDPQESYHTLMKIAKLSERVNESFFEVHNIYLRALEEAKKMHSIDLQRVPVQRAIKLLRSKCMDLMADQLEGEAIAAGITDLNVVPPDSEDLPDGNQLCDLIDYDAEEEEDEEREGKEQNTPNVGDDIDLDADLSDDPELDPALAVGGDANSSALAATKVAEKRKRGKSFHVRRNAKGETQLHQAAIAGKKTLAEQLLQQGHPVNERDYCGWLPLHEACIHGHVDVVSLLLEKGAHVNDKGGTKCEGITPLHDACRNGHLDVIEVLLERGANATLRTDNGETVLSMLDVWYEHLKEPLSETVANQHKRIRECLSKQLEVAAIAVSPPSNRLERSPEKASSIEIRERRRRISSGEDQDLLIRSNEKVLSSIEKRERRHRLSSGEHKASFPRTPDYSPARSIRQTPVAGSSDGVAKSFRHRHSLFDDDDDDGYSPRYSDRPKLSAAAETYRSCMETLRNPTGSMLPIQSTEKRRPKYREIEEDEANDQDWLIDDMKRAPKKSRVCHDLHLRPSAHTFEQSKSSSSITTSGPVTKVKTDCVGIDSLLSTVIDSEDENPYVEPGEQVVLDNARTVPPESNKAYSILMKNSAKSFRKVQNRRNSSESRSGFSSRKSSANLQQSLLDAGFQRVSSPTWELKENLAPQLADDAIMMSPGIKLSGTSPQRLPAGGEIVPTKRVMRVILDAGECYSVPYDENVTPTQTIGWLRNTVVKQYMMNHGKRPTIKMKPLDGSVGSVNPFSDADNLQVLLPKGFGADLTLHGQICGWERIDVEQYYNEYCVEQGIENDKDLRKRLITMDQNEIIAFEPDFAYRVPSKRTPPDRTLSLLFTMIFFQQDCLHTLDFSTNGITDDHMVELVRYLPACRRLRVLRLRLNLLTAKSVELLCFGGNGASSTNTENPRLGDGLLTELDLSQNPLEDAALEPLSRLCDSLSSLRILRIRSADITTFGSPDAPSIDISRLETLDISENDLTERSIQWLLQQLTEDRLKEAHFGSLPVQCTDFKSKLWQTISHHLLDRLQLLNLTNCRLTDEEVNSTLLPALSRNCEALAQLDLSLNVELTVCTFLALLRHCGTAVFRLQEVWFKHDIKLWMDLEATIPSPNATLQLIEYNPSASYPIQIHTMLPVGYSEERYEALLAAIESFWRSLWPTKQSSTTRHKQGLEVSLRVDPFS
uniref:Tonsoku-like protein n=1 Tax=Anopheles dirus TaxID=7168 RepID=A0A182NKG3_9DIPT